MIEVKRTVVFDVSGREVKENGIVARRDVLCYGVVDGATHELVGFAICELSDDKAFDAGQNARHAEVVHHAIDMVMAFADVLDEEDDTFGMRVDDVIEIIGRALQAVENAEVASNECASGCSETVERMSR